VLAIGAVALVNDDVHVLYLPRYLPGATVHWQYIFFKLASKLLKGR
jgi:hypothetical protein